MKNKKKYLWAFIAVFVMIAAVLILKKPFGSQDSGTIRVSVTAVDQSVIREEEIVFREGDTLPELIRTHFDNVDIRDGMIMSIETLDTPEDWSQFISLYLNGEMASEGIETLAFRDGDRLELRMTVFDPAAVS